jgi:hypothetical protein
MTRLDGTEEHLVESHVEEGIHIGADDETPPHSARPYLEPSWTSRPIRIPFASV